jgi:hypothetical protein
MVAQIAKLAGATPAPDTSLEALAPPDVVKRIGEMQQQEPLEVDIRGGKPPGERHQRSHLPGHHRPGCPLSWIVALGAVELSRSCRRALTRLRSTIFGRTRSITTGRPSSSSSGSALMWETVVKRSPLQIQWFRKHTNRDGC